MFDSDGFELTAAVRELTVSSLEEVKLQPSGLHMLTIPD
jgi:hypothetical protein